MLLRPLQSGTFIKIIEIIRQGKLRLIIRKLRVMGIKGAMDRLYQLHKSIYPLNIPSLEVEEPLDFLVLQLPARYHAMMPNGIGYLYMILKESGIRFQVIDINIIFYHRYHSQRLSAGGTITTPSGYVMEEDPWDNTNTGEWDKNEVIDYFWTWVEDVLNEISHKRPKAIGLSIHATNRTISNRFIRELRKRMPEVTIVVGGYDCFSHEVGPALIKDFDYMVIGEAELTLAPLLRELAAGEIPMNVKGILSRFDSPDRKWVEPPLFADLDSIEFPKYEWVDPSIYKTYEGAHLIPITASRGCQWSKCRFCSEAIPFRKRSPKKVVDEIEYFVSRGFHFFHFNESDVNGDPKNLYDICSEIIERDLKVNLVGQLRIHKASNAEYFRHLSRAGFVHLRFGVDAWSENTLRLQRKGYNIKMISQNLRDCHAANIWTTVNVVIGVPGETEEDIEETIDTINKCKGSIDLIESINILILSAGSEYYRAPDLYHIHFLEEAGELYRKYPYYIPSELWYGEDPFIDHTERVKRLNKVYSALHEGKVNVGSFTENAIKHLVDSGKSRS